MDDEQSLERQWLALGAVEREMTEIIADRLAHIREARSSGNHAYAAELFEQVEAARRIIKETAEPLKRLEVQLMMLRWKNRP